MPKKPAKNAYFYFMLEFREEQKKKGITYANMNEVQQAADPVWRAAPASVRAKYETKAKAEKAKYNIPEHKFTTNGVPFSEIESQERQAKDAVERELRDIQNFVRQNAFNQKILDKDIYIIDVNAFCETSVGHVFGEVTVLCFNIRDGVKKHVHELINPPKIPIGYASDIKIGCQELGLDYPDPDTPKTDFLKLLATIVDFLKQGDLSSQILPPLYTLPEKENQVYDFIFQLCQRAHEDETIFRIYKLDILFFYVINSLKNHSNEGLPKESLALAMLRKDAFKYTPGLGCQHHEENDKSTECTKARVKRWAFTVLDLCCPVAGIDVTPGLHVPHDIDVDAVLTMKENKQKERQMPESRATSSCLSRDTDYEDTFLAPSASLHSTWATKSAPKKMQPMRKPTIDTLNFQTKIMAPEISETDFPPLNLGAGRGTGRMTSDLKNLNLNK